MMPRPSSTSAGAVYLDRGRRIEDLREAARRAAERLSTIRRVRLFGSLAAGTPTPRSDADLLVIVETNELADPRARVPQILRALAPLPCPVDLIVLTSLEFERAQAEGQPLVRAAMAVGVDLL